MAFINVLVSVILLTPLLFGNIMQGEDYERYVDQLVYSVAQEAQREFNLSYVGKGGELAKGVKKIDVKFVAHRRGSLEEARKIEVILTERLLQNLNTHEKLRPFLTEYPFTAGRVTIALSYRQEDDSYYKDGSITFVFQTKNNIYYYCYSSETADDEVEMKEPYEEAKEKVLRNSLEGL